MRNYSLTIKRYGRHLNFDTVELLIDELSQYFTERELASGIVNRLTTFHVRTIDENGFVYGFAKNDYRDMEVCCYEYED